MRSLICHSGGVTTERHWQLRRARGSTHCLSMSRRQCGKKQFRWVDRAVRRGGTTAVWRPSCCLDMALLLLAGGALLNHVSGLREEMADYRRAAKEPEQGYEQRHAHGGADYAPGAGESSADKRAPDLAVGVVEELNIIGYESIFDSTPQAFIIDAPGWFGGLFFHASACRHRPVCGGPSRRDVWWRAQAQP